MSLGYDQIEENRGELMKKILLLTLLIISFCNTVQAQYDNSHFNITKENRINLLKGLNTYALMASISSDSNTVAPPILSDAEQTLTMIGVKLTGYNLGDPVLHIDIDITEVDKGIYSGMVGISLTMFAQFVTKPVYSYSTVWKDSSIVLNGDARNIRNVMKDKMNNFLTVYFEANPIQ